jgi:hypothetical protein
MRNESLQLSAEKRVTTAPSIAVGSDFIDEPTVEKPLQCVLPVIERIDADCSVGFAGVVTNADLHAGVVAPLGDGDDAKPFDDLWVERRKAQPGYKAALHAAVLLAVNVKVWGMLARRPVTTYRYARKYTAWAATRIHPSALGGFTLEGPYRRRSRVRAVLNRFFYWLGA